MNKITKNDGVQEFISKNKIGAYYDKGQQQYKLIRNCPLEFTDNFEDIIADKGRLGIISKFDGEKGLEFWYCSRGKWRRDIIYPDDGIKTYKNMVLMKLEKELQSLESNQERYNIPDEELSIFKEVIRKVEKEKNTEKIYKIYDKVL